MKVAVQIIKGDKGYRPKFDCSDIADIVAHFPATPKVSMSRHGDGCFTSITELQEHNKDAPSFSNIEAARQYVYRVITTTEQIIRDATATKLISAVDDRTWYESVTAGITSAPVELTGPAKFGLPPTAKVIDGSGKNCSVCKHEWFNHYDWTCSYGQFSGRP